MNVTMTNPFRSLKLHWRRLLDQREITLDGVRISTDPAMLPRFVRSALFKETYEDYERQLVQEHLKPGDRVLEIGAGIGFISLLCAKICGPENVVSYEANPLLEPIIRANYALNGMTPSLRMRAITTDGQPIAFFRNNNIVSSSVKERQGFSERLEVQSDAFDEVIRKQRPDTIIMDVEGAEIELLSQSALEGIKRIVVEVHPHITGNDKVEGMLDALRTKGFIVQSEAHKTILLTRFR